jgi:ubiquinone/menaquinone biosynthesis methyltransferase
MNRVFTLKIKDHLATPEKKLEYNREHFTESAPRYDFATRALSLGQDTSWKKLLINALPNFTAPNCLDLACGTGDVALALAQRFQAGKITGIDITEAMLEIARKRITFTNLKFENHDIAKLPYADNYFQIITGSYALRNSPNIKGTLSEIFRCLDKDGTCAILDFAKPDSLLAQKLQFYTLKFWGSLWGLLLHANPEVHGYISASLKNYPNRSDLDILIKEAGFTSLKRRSLFGGMMDLLILKK